MKKSMTKESTSSRRFERWTEKVAEYARLAHAGKKIPGKEVDMILKNANDYDKKLQEIRKKLEDMMMLKERHL